MGAGQRRSRAVAFSILCAAGTVPCLLLPAPALARQHPGAHDETVAFGGLAHGVTLGSVALLAGLAAFAAVVWVPACGGVLPGRVANRPFVPLSWALFGALVFAGGVEVTLYAVRASGEAASVALLREALLETRVGGIWLTRVGFAFAAAVTLTLAARREDALLWWAALAFACVPLLTITQLSHAAAEGGALPFVADCAHVAAAAVWTGGLLALSTILLGPLRKAPPAARSGLLAGSLSRFSRLAMLSVAVLVVTGSYAGLLHVPDLPSLFSTKYGQVLLLKLFLVVMMLAVGAGNLRGGERGGDLAFAVRYELAVAVAVFVTTGFLSTILPADAVTP